MVIGGGESAPKQLKQVPEGALLISANQHGCLLTKCDYLVACDNKPGRRYVSPKGLVDLRDFGIPIISPRESMAEYRIYSKVPANSSGVMAAWVAWLMGCVPICLVGMDLYLGKATYFHSPAAQSTGRHLMVSLHMNKWTILRDRAIGAMYRAMGGPLVGIFPAYSPTELPLPIVQCGELLRHCRGQLAKVKETGQVIEVDELTLHRGVRKGRLVKVSA